MTPVLLLHYYIPCVGIYVFYFEYDTECAVSQLLSKSASGQGPFLLGNTEVFNREMRLYLNLSLGRVYLFYLNESIAARLFYYFQRMRRHIHVLEYTVCVCFILALCKNESMGCFCVIYRSMTDF